MGKWLMAWGHEWLSAYSGMSMDWIQNNTANEKAHNADVYNTFAASRTNRSRSSHLWHYM